jgi:hypothetical protein
MRPFRSVDLDTINTWYNRRGLSVRTPDELPSIGLIEPDVAVGFLCRSECKRAFIENYVTNPEAPRKARAQAIDDITAGLLEQAKHRGFTKVLALSRSRSLGRVADRFGLKPIGIYGLVGKEL